MKASDVIQKLGTLYDNPDYIDLDIKSIDIQDACIGVKYIYCVEAFQEGAPHYLYLAGEATL
jgi:hypothetical protein